MSRGTLPKFHLLVLIPNASGKTIWHRVGVGWPTQKGDGGVSIQFSPIIDPAILLKHKVVLSPATEYPSSSSHTRKGSNDKDYAEFGGAPTSTPWPDGNPDDGDDEIPF